MARYHVNPETGQVGSCTAQVQCRFGSDDLHAATPEGAAKAYEAFVAQDDDPETNDFTVMKKATPPPPSPGFADRATLVAAIGKGPAWDDDDSEDDSPSEGYQDVLSAVQRVAQANPHLTPVQVAQTYLGVSGETHYGYADGWNYSDGEKQAKANLAAFVARETGDASQ